MSNNGVTENHGTVHTLHPYYNHCAPSVSIANIHILTVVSHSPVFARCWLGFVPQNYAADYSTDVFARRANAFIDHHTALNTVIPSPLYPHLPHMPSCSIVIHSSCACKRIFCVITFVLQTDPFFIYLSMIAPHAGMTPPEVGMLICMQLNLLE